jgi:phosphate transport system substrate-binding protein
MVVARQGNCANVVDCPLSKSGELLTIPYGAEFSCPVCGQPLTEIENSPPARQAETVFRPARETETVFHPARETETERRPPVELTESVKHPPARRRTGLVVFAAVSAALLLLAALTVLEKGVVLPHASAHGTANVMLRLSGSNTIGETLMPAIAQAFLRSRGATDVHTIAGEKAEEKIVVGTLPGDRNPSEIAIAAHGSATAFTSLADYSCEIGMASRRIKSEEAANLSSLGDMMALANEHIVGLDGIAVIVNVSNPISRLTKDEIMRLFTGETAKWPGGGPVHVYARDDKSGTYDTFKTLVLAGKPLAQGAQRFEDSNELSDAVARDANAIGFIGLPFIRSAKALAVSEKGTDALLPTRLTVATEDYALSRRLYLYTSATSGNQLTRDFVEFALSKQGQEIVAANGFIAQNIEWQAQAPPADAPAGYRQLTHNAQRLTLDFRFQSGAAVGDNKALADMNRILELIADKRASGDKVMLFGFADGQGTAEQNVLISLDRAKAIEQEFLLRGIRPAVVRGFGADLPVASNDTPDGREKNRRVEIWIQE